MFNTRLSPHADARVAGATMRVGCQMRLRRRNRSCLCGGRM